MSVTEAPRLRTKVVPAPGRYTLNLERCLVQFSVKHMLVSTARGTFQPVAGELMVEEDPLHSWVRVDLSSASFDTGSPDRDRAVTGPDFLDADEYPAIRFESVALIEKSAGLFSVPGDLYIKDLVGELEMEARLVTVAPDRIVVAATGHMSRADYGLTWTTSIEKVGVVVADTVKFDIGAEFLR